MISIMSKKLIVIGLMIVFISLISAIASASTDSQTFGDQGNRFDSSGQHDEAIKTYDKELQVTDWTKMLGSVKATFYLNHIGAMKQSK
jgi:hypothetical protein